MPTTHANLGGLDLHEAKRTKTPVRAASTVNITLTAPGASMDGVTLASGDRILLKDQTTPSQNGIYVWNGAVTTATRAVDNALATDFVFGFLAYVREGSINGTSMWVYTQSAAVTVGTTAITFSKLFVGAALSDPTTSRGDLITRSASALVRLVIGTAGQFLGSNGTDPAWGNSATSYTTTGLTGATSPATFAGGTPSGPPASGTHAVGEYVIDLTGKVWICTGAGSPGTWTQAGGGMANPMTTNQDLIVGGGSGLPGRLGIGANNQVLSIVSGVVGWAASAAGFANPMIAIGDMISGGTAGAAIRVPIGGGGQVLTVIGGQPGWANPTGGGGGGTTNNTASSLYLIQNYI